MRQHVLDVIARAISMRGLVLESANPREADHLLLTLTPTGSGPGSATVAAQWFGDGNRARAVFSQTRKAAPDAGVELLSDGTSGGIVVQPGGADRRLRRLHFLAAGPGDALVAHRPERRAVVRRVERGTVTFTKTVAAGRLDKLLQGAGLVVPGVAMPRLLAVQRADSAVTFAQLPGRTLYELLADPACSQDGIERIGRSVGRALALLSRASVPTGLPRHDLDAELAVTQRWVRLAAGQGLLDALDVPVDRLLDLAGALPVREVAEEPVRLGLLHRDLHDKQLLVDGDRIGMLDFDLAALGDPALDLANLLVHLELRALQGRCSPARAGACAAGVLDGCTEVEGAAATSLLRRMGAYDLTTRVRLACVYAFRPRHCAAGAALLGAGAARQLRSRASPRS